MKRLLSIAVMILFTITAYSQDYKVGGEYFKSDTVSTEDAINHLGSPAVVCSDVKWIVVIDTMEGKPALVKLSDSKMGVTLVLWKDDHALFEKPLMETFKTGTKLCAAGPLEGYAGEARMEIGHKEQIHFLK